MTPRTLIPALLVTSIVACVTELPPIPDPAVLKPAVPPAADWTSRKTVVHFKVSLNKYGQPETATLAVEPQDTSLHWAATSIASGLTRWRPAVDRGTRLLDDSVSYEIVPPQSQRELVCRSTAHNTVVCLGSWSALWQVSASRPELKPVAASAIAKAPREKLTVREARLLSPDSLLVEVGTDFSCEDEYHQLLLLEKQRGGGWRVEYTSLDTDLSPECWVPSQPYPTPRWLFARAALREDLVGCYVLGIDDSVETIRRYYHATRIVRLHAEARLGPPYVPGVFRLLTRYDSLGRNMDARFKHFGGWEWWVDSLSDTVRLRFGDGFSGARFSFGATPTDGTDTLRGRADNNWDFGPPFRTDRARAWAVHTPCPTD